MSPDREEEAIIESPEAVADEMSEATERLRDQGWMIAPLTKGPIETPQAPNSPKARTRR